MPIGNPSLHPVMIPIVPHVATLAKRLQVPAPVMRRIMIKMRGGEHDTCGPKAKTIHHVR